MKGAIEMSKKSGILVVVLIFPLLLFSVYAIKERDQKGTPRQNKYPKSVKMVNLNNANIISKEELRKGCDLIFKKDNPKEASKYLPSISIKTDKEYEFAAFVIDQYNNVFTKAQACPNFKHRGKEIEYCWGNASNVWNGKYRFYIALWEPSDDDSKNEEIVRFFSDPITININKNNPPGGFYILSPLPLPDYGGLNAPFSIDKMPTIAWIDTVNKNVKKYQLFHAIVEYDKKTIPLVDSINSNLREIKFNPKLLQQEEFSPGRQDAGPGPVGFDSFLIRAVFSDDSFRDSEVGGLLEINP